MTDSYEDMIYLPHPVSVRRKRMSLSERAAQFAPFAALSGFSSAIENAQQQVYMEEYTLCSAKSKKIPR